MNKFIIWGNEFLKKITNGYYNEDYVGAKESGNPNYLLVLKNTYKSESLINLNIAKKQVKEHLKDDIPQILEAENLNNPICVVIPRSKASFTDSQQFFRLAISEFCDENFEIENGSKVIIRNKDTYTTHFRNEIPNFDNIGDKPYSGITKDTCVIDAAKIQGRDVILVDDIYTRTVNIDEDCIQCLYDLGAKKVVFYAIAKTRGKNEI